MNAADIKGLTDEELTQKIEDEIKRLQKLKFAHTISPLENPSHITTARKLVARLKTENSARKLAQKQNA